MNRIFFVFVTWLIAGGCAAAKTLVGTVIEDHSGYALPHSEVRVALITGTLVADVETGPNGRFDVSGLAPGGYLIEISKSNYTSTRLRLKVPLDAPRAILCVRLVRRGVITGRVTDSKGRPVPGAKVFALMKIADTSSLLLSNQFGPGGIARTDANGQYRLYDLPIGEYVVAAAPYSQWSSAAGSNFLLYPNNTEPESFKIFGGEELRGVDLAVFPVQAYRVSGILDLPESAERFSVALVETKRPTLAVSTVLTELGGKFQLTGVPPGSYDILASGPVIGKGPEGAMVAPEPLFGRTHIDIIAQDFEEAKVSMSRGRSVTFVLRSAIPQRTSVSCPQGVTLTLSNIEDWGTQIRIRTQLNATEERGVDNVPPGRYHLTAVGAGTYCYPAIPSILDLSPGVDATSVSLPVMESGSVQGRLTGTTVPTDFLVLLGSWRPADGGHPIEIAYPDADARFTFSGLSAGTYWLAVRSASASGILPVAGAREPFTIKVLGGRLTQVEIPAPRQEIGSVRQIERLIACIKGCLY